MMRVARRRGALGFSLIEVLVALFIAAIGVLGIAAIILFSLRASFESRQQSVAALLAIDTHERAWLSAHEASTNFCRQDWIDLVTFAPGRTIDGLTATVSEPEGGDYPDCVFTVEWEASEVGVVGGMVGFGGMYTHNFTIPSTVGPGN